MAATHPSADTPIAAIDMGSNSFHLLVAGWQDGCLQPLHAEVERVQTAILMDGARLTGVAEKRILDCLAHFRDVAEHHGCQRIVAVGTSAMRQATNPESLLRAAEQLLGWPVIILDGDEEARYIYQAVARYQVHGRHKLVIDIGGGSTELILGRGEHIETLESLPLGCVRSLKKHFHNGALNRRAFDDSVEDARTRFAAVANRFSLHQQTAIIGCSGTAQAAAAVLGVERLVAADLFKLRDRILDRFANTGEVRFACLDANRSSLLAPGLSLLVALFEALAIEEMELADVALREGIALGWYRGDARLQLEAARGIAI